MEPVLGRFDVEDAATVASWARSRDELARWVSRTDHPLDPEIVRGWGRAPDVRPFALRLGDAVVAYGEVWTDTDEHEAELARLIVAPELRGRGLGRRLVLALAEEARRSGFDEIWLRVVPDNAPAIACYEAAGFVAADPDTERSFNAGQPSAYRWMRAPD